MTFLLSPFLNAGDMPFDNAQVASFDSPPEAVAPHGDHGAAGCRSKQPAFVRSRKRLTEGIVAKDEQIVSPTPFAPNGHTATIKAMQIKQLAMLIACLAAGSTSSRA